jgi:hypothetical protein
MSRSEHLKASMQRAGFVCLIARSSQEKGGDGAHKQYYLLATSAGLRARSFL